jgi:hypothetical protein
MGGGLLQLVAYGAQDVYLTGNPQITFFKVVYRRHTNFAMEAIQQTFSGTVNFGGTVYCQISRNGDLIHRTYLQVDLPVLSSTLIANHSYVNFVGLRLLKSITIEIGGQQIDKHYADWLYIWNELSLPLGKRNAYYHMVGADKDLVNVGANSTNGTSTTLFIPFEFWFCRNIGLALPLIALQYHEVRIKIDFAPVSDCLYKTSDGTSTAADYSSIALSNANIWVDYIYLDTDERRKFAQLSHEYLIEQLQFTGAENLSSNTNSIKLNFNHPVKELVWVGKFNGTSGATKANNQWYNYTWPYDGAPSQPFSNALLSFPQEGVFDTLDTLGSSNLGVASITTTGTSSSNISNLVDFGIQPYIDSSLTNSNINPFGTCLLQLNGNDRFSVRNGNYFNLVQQYQHHTNISLNRGINVYSFALKPEEHQPSGSLNMSRIDTAVLQVSPLQNVSGNILIYAVNYNVLRILSGMGGLAYSN